MRLNTLTTGIALYQYTGIALHFKTETANIASYVQPQF